MAQLLTLIATAALVVALVLIGSAIHTMWSAAVFFPLAFVVLYVGIRVLYWWDSDERRRR